MFDVRCVLVVVRWLLSVAVCCLLFVAECLLRVAVGGCLAFVV